MSAPAAILGSDHSVLFPAIALRYALLHLPHSLDPGKAAGGVVVVVVVAIDRAAQGETKRRARA